MVLSLRFWASLSCDKDARMFVREADCEHLFVVNEYVADTWSGKTSEPSNLLRRELWARRV